MAAGFFGRRSVLARMRKQPNRHGGTLKVRGAADTFTSVAWAQANIAPTDERTALDGGGVEPITATGYLYQTGEADAYRPRPDDQFVDYLGNTWLITAVKAENTGDSGSGVFSCSFSRVG